MSGAANNDDADGLSAETMYDVKPDPVAASEPVPVPTPYVEAPLVADRPVHPALPAQTKRRLPIIKWLLMTVGGLVAFSIVQVCVYRFMPVPVTILMIERLSQGNGLDHRWIGADRISSNLKSAVIAAEDAKFCTHDGFDYDAIRKAEKYNATHKKKRGASTISQQTAKNVFPVAVAVMDAQGLRGLLHLPDRAYVAQGTHHGGLSQQRRMGPGGIRRGIGVAILVPSFGRDPVAGRGLETGRHPARS